MHIEDTLYVGSSWSAEEEREFTQSMEAAEAAFEHQFDAVHVIDDIKHQLWADAELIRN